MDGTLLDTLQDLWMSTNHALRSCGMPERSRDEVRQFVGNGVGLLIHRAVPEGTLKEKEERCFQAFRAHYVRHCQDHTAPYPGIDEMLKRLKEKGFKMGIVSNKLQAGVTELHEAWFKDTIDVAIGESEDVHRKPAPDMVLRALEAMDVKTTEAVYVGDSDVDIETARRAGLPCISVLWGFRSRDFLVAHGATTLVKSPQDVLSFV